MDNKKAVYFVEYVSEQGGGSTVISDAFVAESEGDAIEYAMKDQYFVSLVSSGFERDATEAELKSDEVLD